jgi:hypothetical protein
MPRQVSKDRREGEEAMRFTHGKDSVVIAGSRAPAGWRRYYSSSGDWWFEKMLPGGGSVRFAPKWMCELRDQSYKNGMKAVRNVVKSALGLEISE